MARKVVITCALTGSADTVDKNPAVPVTPRQIAESALDAAKAGAAVVHVHVRDPDTGQASMDPALYREVVARVRDSGSEVVLNLTTGAGGRFMPGDNEATQPGPGTTLTTPAVRTRHVEELRPEICSLDVATMNFGENAFVNVPKHLRDMAGRAKASGVKPELEVFDTGHVELAKKLIADGHIDTPPLFQLCLGIPYGAPATPESMIHLRNLLPEGAVWSAFGISRHEFPMVALAVMLGGNVRVGLEDNLYLSHGELAPSNAALVEKAAGIIETMGAEVATPAEARGIFHLESTA
jgi:uncharacterized protein (DUF849 family)